MSKRVVRGLLLVWLITAGTARAEDPWLTVDARADSCVDASRLRREVDGLLAERPAGVVVEAVAAEGGWTLELRHADGQRASRVLNELPDDCGQRLHALALTTALALEHALAAPPIELGLDWALGMSAGGSVGELRAPVPLLGIDARIERGAWVPLELLASFDLGAARTRLGEGSLTTRQLTSTLGTCGGGGRARWRVDGCLGVELGLTIGQGERLPSASRELAGSGAVSGGAVARWAPWRRLALTLRLDGFVRFWVPTFRVLDAEGEVFAEHALPAAGARLRLGVAWLSR